MSDTFIEMIRNIDFLYGFIINITKNEHIKEYNTYIEDTKDVENICSYLMSICFERYFKLSKNEYSKIK